MFFWWLIWCIFTVTSSGLLSTFHFLAFLRNSTVLLPFKRCYISQIPLWKSTSVKGCQKFWQSLKICFEVPWGDFSPKQVFSSGVWAHLSWQNFQYRIWWPILFELREEIYYYYYYYCYFDILPHGNDFRFYSMGNIMLHVVTKIKVLIRDLYKYSRKFMKSLTNLNVIFFQCHFRWNSAACASGDLSLKIHILFLISEKWTSSELILSVAMILKWYLHYLDH